tara:strand:+ start:1112 stop:2488 length:1377 start_codon:yes stop_codon:yes gene_type:complete
MAEMTKEQMEKLMKRREETMAKARQSPDFTAAPEEVPLPKDRPKNLKDFVEEVFKEDSSFTRDPFADATEEEKEEAEAELQRQMEEEKKTKKAEGGSVEKKADFVKDDDEEPNDPPPGAKPEEVADDIPAYLSTGEYVLPANVVRYLGLERIVSMHKGALAALQQMEDLDIIENVDENGMVEEDDDEMDYLKKPKGVVKTTLVVAKPHPSGMMAMPFQEGGEADATDEMDPDNTGFAGPDRGDQGFGTGLDEGGEDEEEDSLGLGKGSKGDDPGQQAIDDLLERSIPGYGSPDIEPDKKDFTFDTSKEPPRQKGPLEKVGNTLQKARNAPGLMGLVSGIAGDALVEAATFDITPGKGGGAGVPGGFGSLEDMLGVDTEEPDMQDLGEDARSSDPIDVLATAASIKLDDDDDDDADKDDSEFVFQPGVGFIPRRRFLRRVQTLKEGDLPTARKGGLMGQ